VHSIGSFVRTSLRLPSALVLVGGREGEGRKPLYFASVDMERCYDNIHVHQLLDIFAGKWKPTRAFGRPAVSHVLSQSQICRAAKPQLLE
jgi:hypothetical protein